MSVSILNIKSSGLKSMPVTLFVFCVRFENSQEYMNRNSTVDFKANCSEVQVSSDSWFNYDSTGSF